MGDGHTRANHTHPDPKWPPLPKAPRVSTPKPGGGKLGEAAAQAGWQAQDVVLRESVRGVAGQIAPVGGLE